MSENQGKENLGEIVKKLEDNLDELRRVVRDLSDETTKIIAATVDISSKLTEFVVKQDYVYKSILELVDLLKKAAAKEDPLVREVRELKEEIKNVEVILRKIHTRLAVTGVKIKKETEE